MQQLQHGLAVNMPYFQTYEIMKILWEYHNFRTSLWSVEKRKQILEIVCPVGSATTFFPLFATFWH